MPIYEYECGDCQKITDAYRRVADLDNCPPCECGGKTKKIISAFWTHSDLTPYYDDNLQTHIQSKQHRKKVMKQQGVCENFGQGWHTSSVKHRKV